MKVGIIGYAGSGKTTIFNALTATDGDTTPGKPGRINLREVWVPDERIDQLSELYQPQKTIYAKVTLADLPGQAPGSGGGFDAQMVAKMREMELLVIVVRAFESPFALEAPNPTVELGSMLAELLLADLSIIERRIDRIKKDASLKQEKAFMERLQEALENETWLSELELSAQELESISGYRFLTLKPVLALVNTPEEAADEASAQAHLAPLKEELGVEAFALSGQLESEIAALAEDEQRAFLEDMGIQGTARDRFIREVYGKLDLISFFTVGEDEVRAWPVSRGANAQEAAGKIHTDLSKHFIRAERMVWSDILEYGSEAKVKEAGRFELKGKTYIVEDGDILHIRANA